MSISKPIMLVLGIAVASAPVQGTEFALDRFEITRDNNTNWFTDDFLDGTVPPSSEGVFPDNSPASYLVAPNPLPGPEQGGKLMLDTAKGEEALSGVSGNPILIQRARLLTNTSDDPADINRGLKDTRTFEIKGTFDLIEPTINGELYGIRLVDFGQPDPDDNVQLQVQRSNSGEWVVRFVEADFDLGTFNVIDSYPLAGVPNLGDYEQIALMLNKEDSSNNLISASFELIDLDAVLTPFAYSMTGTAEIFNGERWTRASFLAVAPKRVPEPRDFGGDGKADILLRNSGTGQLYLWEMDGNVKTPSNIGGLNPVWDVVGIDDLGGDGRADIVLRHSSTGQLYLFEMDGNSITPSNIGALNPVWDVVGLDDFGGDGRADLLLRHSLTGQLYLFEMDGSSVTPSNIGALSLAWDVAGTGDFGGDGNADILLRHSTTGQLYLFEMDGNVKTPSNIGALNPVWDVVGVRDLGGDGNADIVLRHSSTGQLYLFEMDGNVRTGSNIGALNPVWDVVQLSDFGGDGKSDLLLRHSGTGQLYLFEMDGNSITPSNIGGLNPVWVVQ
jgi:hypothetical protein